MGIECMSGMLESDMRSFFLTNVTANVAFMAGSSKHGKAFLASVGSNCVVARYLNKTNIFVYECMNDNRIYRYMLVLDKNTSLFIIHKFIFQSQHAYTVICKVKHFVLHNYVHRSNR